MQLRLEGLLMKVSCLPLVNGEVQDPIMANQRVPFWNLIINRVSETENGRRTFFPMAALPGFSAFSLVSSPYFLQ